jgi:hypothetical protein
VESKMMSNVLSIIGLLAIGGMVLILGLWVALHFFDD